MNYLAHLYFGRKTEASLVGNLLGDFIKGNEMSLRENLPSALVDGILMHRKIDIYTDSIQEFKAAKLLLSSHLVKYAGIIIDVIYDHFLAKHWELYHSQSLRDFCDYCYQTLKKHPEWHSEELSQRLPPLIKNDVLFQYQYKSSVKKTLQSISNRSKRTIDLTEAYNDFERNYTNFEQLFFKAFPLINNYAETLSPSAALQILEKEQDSVSNDAELIQIWRLQAEVMARKNNRSETIHSFLKAKGVTDRAAEEASQSILYDISKQKNKAANLLKYPAYLFLLLGGVIFCISLINNNLLHSSAFRSIVASFLSFFIGLMLIHKSKSF